MAYYTTRPKLIDGKWVVFKKMSNDRVIKFTFASEEEADLYHKKNKQHPK